jgi:hypothetical protein
MARLNVAKRGLALVIRAGGEVEHAWIEDRAQIAVREQHTPDAVDDQRLSVASLKLAEEGPAPRERIDVTVTKVVDDDSISESSKCWA